MRDIYAEYDIEFTKGNITRDDSGDYTEFEMEYNEAGCFAGTRPELERFWRETRTGRYDELYLYIYHGSIAWGGVCTFLDIL